MRKSELSDEKIMELLKEGWHFHTKEQSGNLYIVTRKGQDMKSHGRCTQEYLTRIRLSEEKYESNTREEVVDASHQEDASTRHRRINIAKNQLLRKLVIDRGTVKTLSCVHIKDSFCTKWMYDKEANTTFIMRELFRPGVEYYRDFLDNGSSKQIIRVSTEYCSGCTMFKPRKDGKNFDLEWYLHLK